MPFKFFATNPMQCPGCTKPPIVLTKQKAYTFEEVFSELNTGATGAPSFLASKYTNFYTQFQNPNFVDDQPRCTFFETPKDSEIKLTYFSKAVVYDLVFISSQTARRFQFYHPECLSKEFRRGTPPSFSQCATERLLFFFFDHERKFVRPSADGRRASLSPLRPVSTRSSVSFDVSNPFAESDLSLPDTAGNPFFSPPPTAASLEANYADLVETAPTFTVQCPYCRKNIDTRFFQTMEGKTIYSNVPLSIALNAELMSDLTFFNPIIQHGHAKKWDPILLQSRRETLEKTHNILIWFYDLHGQIIEYPNILDKLPHISGIGEKAEELHPNALGIYENDILVARIANTPETEWMHTWCFILRALWRDSKLHRENKGGHPNYSKIVRLFEADKNKAWL